MTTPPFPTPPRAITHAELLRELEPAARAELHANNAALKATDSDDILHHRLETAYRQGQRHAILALIKKAEGRT